MLRPETLRRVTQALPFLAHAPAELTRDFLSEASIHAIPAGTQIFAEGDECSAIAILLSGVVRVFKVGETGREITLYRFTQGESCILTANCILGNHQFPAIALVERDAEAVVISATAFQDWVNRYQPWRDYVFDLLSRRLASVMAIVDEVAFRRMDARIADFLARRLSPLVSLGKPEGHAGDSGRDRPFLPLESFARGRAWVVVPDQSRLTARTVAWGLPRILQGWAACARRGGLNHVHTSLYRY